MIKTPVCVDISHYDDVNSFHDVKDAGIEICIVKCTQGLTVTDPKYVGYVKRSQSVDLVTGSYHFGSMQDGNAQAKFFLDNCIGKTLMMLDFERYPKSQMSIHQAEQYVKYTNLKTGVYPLLYYGDYLIDAEKDHRLSPDSILRKCPGMCADYNTNFVPHIKNMDNVLWQFTGDGVGNLPHGIKGIEGDAVDLSVWLGSLLDIRQWAKKHSF